jgi:hypothetical protein
MRHKKILSHTPQFRNAIIFPIKEKRGKAIKWDLGLKNSAKGQIKPHFATCPLEMRGARGKNTPPRAIFFALLTT